MLSWQYNTSEDSLSSQSSNSSFSSNSSSPDDDDDDGVVEILDEPKFKKVRKNDDEHDANSELNYNFASTVTCKWCIGDLNKICEKEVGYKIKSPTFVTSGEEWCLNLYPKGFNDSNKNHFSVFIELLSSKEFSELKVEYSLGIHLNKRCLVDTKNTETFSPGQQFGIKRTIKTSSFSKVFNNFIGPKKLFINCSLSFQSKSPANKLKLVNDLKSLFDSRNFSDSALKVGNEVFQVHKFILAARSPVFAAMFTHDMIENQQNEVVIVDIEASIMMEVLRFIYTGEVEKLEERAEALLLAADKYELTDLKDMCEKFLCRNLHVQNVVDYVLYADTYNVSKLKEHAFRYFVDHVQDVIKTTAFKEMSKTQSPLMAQIICLLAKQKKN